MHVVVLAVLLVGVWCGTVAAQHTSMSTQQCANCVQELVLSDIAYQELRGRCANIVRQAYELEADIKRLKDINGILEKEVARLKGTSSEHGDGPTRVK